jgi:aspartyl-tRNA(Asn)/glutamyl-tRNA(Gln) amidotransferase subunit A
LNAAPSHTETRSRHLRGLRIAFSSDLGCGFAIDADVLEVIEGAVSALGGAGYRIEEADPVWPAGTSAYPLLALQQAGLAALYGRQFEADRTQFDPDIAAQIELGLRTGGAQIAEVLLLRERIYASLNAFFGRYDLLICPTSPVTSWPVDLLGPPLIGGLPTGPRGHAAYTPLFNYCGVPACSVPAGLVRGLPVGLQIVAPRYEDARVLHFARAVEHLLDLKLTPVGLAAVATD